MCRQSNSSTTQIGIYGRLSTVHLCPLGSDYHIDSSSRRQLSVYIMTQRVVNLSRTSCRHPTSTNSRPLPLPEDDQNFLTRKWHSGPYNVSPNSRLHRRSGTHRCSSQGPGGHTSEAEHRSAIVATAQQCLNCSRRCFMSKGTSHCPYK